jgi:hypothetical protein
VQVGVCAYRRVDRLAATLANLAGQKDAEVTVFLWDNTEGARATLEAIAADAEIAVQIEGTSRNLGGLGLFAFLREAARVDRPIILIDDDVTLASDAVVQWLEEWAPLTLSSFWAFRFCSYGDYFDRVRVGPGAPAHYCGTGGTVLDGTVLQDPGLFTCPPRYRMLWDLWLSFRATQCGFQLRGSAADVRFVTDGKDVYRGLIGLKSECLRYLVSNGWRLDVSGRGGV